MATFSWLTKPCLPVHQSLTESFIRRSLPAIGLPFREIEPRLWVIQAPPLDTYSVTLSIWAEQNNIQLIAASELCVERDLLPRDLLLNLLESPRFEYGFFRLVPVDQKQLVVLSGSLNAQRCSIESLRLIGEAMIEHMQMMICRLYAMDLIIAGPHDSARHRNGLPK